MNSVGRIYAIKGTPVPRPQVRRVIQRTRYGVRGYEREIRAAFSLGDDESLEEVSWVMM